MQKTDTTKSTRAFPPHEVVVWGLAALGILLRLRQYFFDRSLWLDEALVVLNIIHRTPRELLKPLDYHQGAPLGFLVLEKTAVSSLGSSELVLRLIPILCGILSVIVFTSVARRFLAPAAIPLAVGLFAISDPLIYYSSEAKQYSSDVAITVLLYLCAGYLLEREMQVKRVVIISIIGAIALWFSQPAAFILPAVGLSWLLDSLHASRRRTLALLCIPALVWTGTFLASYLVSLRGLTHDGALLEYWGGAFAPFPPRHLADLRWFIDSFFEIFSDPTGLTLTGIAAVAATLGAIELFSKQRARFVLFLTPIALTLAASVLHLYPFRGRLLLFLTPSFILLISAGLESIHTRTRTTLPYLSALLVGFLFMHPLLSAARHLVEPQTKEEIKPMIEYVRNHRTSGDVLYVYYSSVQPFQYYSERNLIDLTEEVIGIESREHWKSYKQDLERLRGRKRVWILFSHVYRAAGVDEERLLLNYLDEMGNKLDSSRSAGASVYLYDLSNKSDQQKARGSG